MSRYVISLCLAVLLAGFLFLLSSLGIGQNATSVTTSSDTLAVELLDTIGPDEKFSDSDLPPNKAEALPEPQSPLPSRKSPQEPSAEPEFP
ncbi:MAG: hypothetical protein MRY59_03735 [Aquisalinus sp.]|nr:hypothetical protein [Aquisalinus sp.]